MRRRALFRRNLPFVDHLGSTAAERNGNAQAYAFGPVLARERD
jgi:hypothetical protein